MTFVEKGLTEVTFSTLSGDLTVTKRGELYEMNRDAGEHPERIETMSVRELWRVIFRTTHREFNKDSEGIRA